PIRILISRKTVDVDRRFYRSWTDSAPPGATELPARDRLLARTRKTPAGPRSPVPERTIASTQSDHGRTRRESQSTNKPDLQGRNDGHGWVRTSDLSRVKYAQPVAVYCRVSPDAAFTGDCSWRAPRL